MARSIQAAVLSKDANFLTIFQEVTSKLAVEVIELDDARRYLDLISQEPFDLLILDCRGFPKARHLVAGIREMSANREAIFIIAADQDEPGAANVFGEHVRLAEPVTREQVKLHLQDALPVIRERHRYYDRHPLEIDVFIACDAKNWGLTAKSINLSEGGLALQLPQHIHLGAEDIAKINFELPEGGGKIEAAAQLTWSNNDLEAGFRFKPLTPSNSARLSAWLNQHAMPLPGAARKQFVESWLAEHGKESGTIIISAGLRSRLLPQKKAETLVEPAPEPVIAPAPESPAGKPGKKWWYAVGVIGFLLGIAAGIAIAKIVHLL